MARTTISIAPNDPLVHPRARTAALLGGLAVLLACSSEGSPAPGGDDTTTGTSIDLDAGESVLCTFTNAQRGPLDVTKTVTAGPTLVSGTTYRVVYDVTVTAGETVVATFVVGIALTALGYWLLAAH